ncbi:MAG: EAL domain-containing protein [Hyphomicrobiales bacterium]|nr:EAL domain-containing protein [Hyphomicrobiales bacterium]
MQKLDGEGTFDLWRIARARRDPRLDQLSEEEQGELRADRINAIMRLTPALIGANFWNAVALMWVFSNNGRDGFLGLWFCVIIIMLSKWYLDWRKISYKPVKKTLPERIVHKIAIFSFILGIVWASSIYMLFIDATGKERTILLCVAAGIICGGSLTLSTIWQAALCYGAPILIAVVASILRVGDPAYYSALFFVLTYSVIIGFAVAERSELFVSSRLNIFKLRAIGALRERQLEEIEQNSAEIQWQTDAQGRLRFVSERLADLFKIQREYLEMTPLNTVFAGGRPSPIFMPDSADVRHIRSCMRHQRPITRRTISPMLRGESRCWAIIGQPQFDTEGKFAGFSGTVSDVTDILRNESSNQIQTDALTNLPNRVSFQRVVETRLKSSSAGFSVLSLDLDGFKAVNDSHGHAVGDELLRQCADRMRRDIRPDELVARLGGDEFSVVLSAALPEMVHNIAMRVLTKLSEPYSIDGKMVEVGVSIGFAVAPQDGTSFKQLFHNSDLALYRAKTGGKGQVVAFSREMDSEHQNRRQLEMDLRNAVGTPQISLVYQPIIDLSNGRVVACEALVRWKHPERGNIPPSDFIPLAEESGIIMDLGNWITEAACREAMYWPDSVRIAINVSTVQFRNLGFVAHIESVLAATGLPARRLEVEITESVLVKDQARTVAIFQKLRQSGVRISLDDFGTGYSSLAYLSDFSIDTIKIDQSFVRKMPHQYVAATIVRAITTLAENLGVATVGEGVETREQLQLLAEHGCDEAQGYLFSAPVSASDIGMMIDLRNSGAVSLRSAHAEAHHALEMPLARQSA